MSHIGSTVVKDRRNDNGRKYKDLDKAILDDIKLFDIECAQIYTHGPRNASLNNVNFEAVKRISSNNFPIYCHSCYSCLPWKDDEKRFHLCEDELKYASIVGSSGVVVHLPKDTISVITENMKKMTKLATKHKQTILIEPPAMKREVNLTYETPEMVNKLTESLMNLPNWGWCLDTAHIHSTGGDIRTRKNADEWLNSLKYPEKVKLIHFNGSHRALGSGVDKHAVPFIDGGLSGADNLWGNVDVLSRTGGYSFIKFADAHKIDILLEPNYGTDKEIETCIKQMKKIRSK